MFIKFDKFIEMFADEEYPSDFWSDVAIISASEMLDGFSDADWLELLTVVDSKSDFWVLRLCETLGDPDERALVVLLKVTSRRGSQAIYVALESIRSMISLGLDVSAYADEINAATERARQTTGKVSLLSTFQ
ncbi:hypothetical protein SAMN04488483_1529 [Pseudomonas helmanticensis]|uniref:Uncharacterized protein n=1 Tax=Pseudomonas helmanticensis TaxID=1471381 RepID=A0ACD2U2Z0_9PSED|nr:hypothetical protein [Pseudomonas helmanticensis]SMQ24268.1 hypothetical protein SAMN04488483_1529 [Pseudomonas helmanticensis]